MRTIPLHLVNEEGSNSDSTDDLFTAWPGTEVDVDVTVPPPTIRAIWIGVSLDGASNKPFELTASVASIILAGWPRVYKGTEIVDGNGVKSLYSDNLDDVNFLLNTCCGTNIATQSLALKQSNLSLKVTDPNPPCDGEAFFKWLAVIGTNEDRTVQVLFHLKLTSADTLTVIEGDILDVSPSNTVQQVLSWFADFVGLTVGADTIVANDVVAGVNEVNVDAFDFGIIEMTTTILDTADDSVISTATSTFRLPGSNCGDGGSSSDSGE